MPEHKETKNLRFSAKDLFDLVADVEKYPEFLPWCSGSRIIEKGTDFLVADLIITFKPFSEKFRSRVNLVPPTETKTGKINVEFLEGPFSHLTNEWVFTPLKEGSTLDFHINFTFRSKIFEKLMGMMFEKAFKKMSAAFEKRAEEIYS